MKFKPHETNELNNFIDAWYMDDSQLSICDRLIDYHKTSDRKRDGHMGATKIINKEKKNSIDVSLWAPSETADDYYVILGAIVQEYIKKYPAINWYAPWQITQNPNIQYYPPNGGYFIWHSENINASENSTRMLAYMTYLNDVEDAGETEWLYQ
jgi:hypothetical protein